MPKTTLYIDVDETIMAPCYGRHFDLRPGVLTQLRILGKLFDCRWLTYWPYNKGEHHEDLITLMRNLYGHDINKVFKYCKWEHAAGKAFAILQEGMPQDFYWLEDPLMYEDLELLENAGRLDRYIQVEPRGNWAFADACLELFNRSGITTTDIKRVGESIDCFYSPFAVIQSVIEDTSLTADERLKKISIYVDANVTVKSRGGSTNHGTIEQETRSD